LICAALVEGAAWSVIAYAYIWGQPADSAEIVPGRVITAVQGAR
jgi:hypothetical protein